ncbi:MAG: methyltransferase family protein [candidate division WOR-3 bacterium]
MNSESDSYPVRLGRFLFRIRGFIGTIAFVPLWLTGRPGLTSCLNSLTLIIPGLLLRFWTAGYIGPESRQSSISASRIVSDGPYRYFRHPLYLGNFALVAGLVVALQPPALLGLGVLAGFLLIYSLIARAETDFLNRSVLKPVCAGFKLKYALIEWQTWLVTLAALGLVLVKVLLFHR